MEQFRVALRSLTLEICRQLEGLEVPTRPVWTVVNRAGTPAYVAMDVSRPALSDLRFSLTISLLKLPEYVAVAEAAEKDPELSECVLIDAGGFFQKPEPTNITRALVTNFIWRYLRGGEQREWDDSRFDETFNEFRRELSHKSITVHGAIPLSNLKTDIEELDFGDGLTLLPASTAELERWINRNNDLPIPGGGPPQWNTHYIDRPAVLHTRQILVGRPRGTQEQAAIGNLPRINVGHAITALRLVMDTPISIILQEQDSEGLMAFGGLGTSWGWSPVSLSPVGILDQEKAAQVTRVWQLLQTSPNVSFLTLPLRRWEASLLRPTIEDRLIDAWISLEALLLDGKEGELAYRAATRLAELLGANGTNRKAIYQAARLSYTWRSVIVHGLSQKKIVKRQSLQAAEQTTREYARAALLKILDLPTKFDPNDLEFELLSREGPSS